MIALDCALIRHLRIGLRLPPHAEMTSVIAPSSDAECSPHQAGVVRAMCHAEVQAIPVGSHGND